MKNLNQISLLILLSIIVGCSNDVKNERTSSIVKNPNEFAQKNLKSTEDRDYDACDCNKRSREILDKTIAFRLKYENINDLKTDQKSKLEIKKFAKEYIALVKKCFEINNARLLVESECNNLKILQAKKDSLLQLGIQIDQGEAIRL